MAFTFGFYNSLNGDRRYDAIQMSSIFDGIIRDGIFMSIGTSMMVTAGTGMMVNIGIGRAWFDHTWSLNSALFPVTLDQSEVLQDRIDTIVLEIDSTESVRKNSYKIVRGQPSTNPVRPALIKTLTRKQYPLCDIRVNRGVTSITQSNITNRVGTSDAPFITGILQTMNIDALVAQWGDQWKQFFDEKTRNMIIQESNWINQHNAWFAAHVSSADSELAEWRFDRENTFDDWFKNLQVILDGDVAANLTANLLDLKFIVNRLTTQQIADHTIQDSDGNPILDSVSNEIMGRIIFVIK